MIELIARSFLLRFQCVFYFSFLPEDEHKMTLLNVDRTYFVSLTDPNNCKIRQRPQDVLFNHTIESVGGRDYFEND